jgi:DNA-binding GntR family transcriptional regulator
MAGLVRCSVSTQSPGLTELRLLVELSALRKLADRGLSDHELSVIRDLAGATMRAARSGDVRGYLQADTVFHLYLLELAGDRARTGVARLLLAPVLVHALPAEESGRLMAAGAGEHRQLVTLLADDMFSAADDLLRRHVSVPWASGSAPAPVLDRPGSFRREGG